MATSSGNFQYRERPLPEDFCWPDGARMAVALTFDYQGEVGLPKQYTGVRRDLKQITEHIYEPRVGIWRLLDVLERFGVSGTFPTCGRSVELYARSCEEILARGHELAAHGYEHEKLNELSLEGEAKVIELTLEAFDRVLGHRPVGWRSPYYLATEATSGLLASMGFLWQSDFHDDDLPYLLESDDGGALLHIPPQMDDWPRYWSDVDARSQSVRGNPRDILSVLVDSFEVLYRESRVAPKMLCVTLHPQIVGRPDRIVIVEEFLEHAFEKPDVWWPRCVDVLSHVNEWLSGGDVEGLRPRPEISADAS